MISMIDEGIISDNIAKNSIIDELLEKVAQLKLS